MKENIEKETLPGEDGPLFWKNYVFKARRHGRESSLRPLFLLHFQSNSFPYSFSYSYSIRSIEGHLLPSIRPKKQC